jgi:hypothetical protein
MIVLPRFRTARSSIACEREGAAAFILLGSFYVGERPADGARAVKLTTVQAGSGNDHVGFRSASQLVFPAQRAGSSIKRLIIRESL